MTHHQHKLAVRTLGGFTLVCDNRPVPVDWPDNATKMLFCSLLSPLDVTISQDRLCKALWGQSATERNTNQLAATIDQLRDVLTKTCGLNPIIAQHDGITLDSLHVSVDARDFHETAILGLRELACGNRYAAQQHFQTATTLYHGAFLPRMTGRIIAATRTELALQHQLLARQIKPLSTAPELKIGRQPAVLFCAV